MALRYVVTGCAGSGTRWASRLFTALGSPCGHQRVHRVLGTYHRRGRGFEGDSSFFAAPLQHDVPVLLLIRNPLHVVRSLDRMTGFLDEDGTADDKLTIGYIAGHRPHVVRAADRMGRLLRYVACWDDGLNTTNVHALPIEDATAHVVADLFERLTGRAVSPATCQRVLDRLGTRIGSHGGPTSAITWDHVRDHLDGQPVIAKAQQRGYL